MTPCEKLGYKVGDRFEAVRDCYNAIDQGDILVLVHDDGTSEPEFKDQAGSTWYGGIEGISTIDIDLIVRPLKTSTTLKSGDEITLDGKKYRVILEEIPQYDFKPGMMCRVVWDGTEYCDHHTKSDNVVFAGISSSGRYEIQYQHSSGGLCTGYVKTTNLRPE